MQLHDKRQLNTRYEHDVMLCLRWSVLLPVVGSSIRLVATLTGRRCHSNGGLGAGLDRCQGRRDVHDIL